MKRNNSKIFLGLSILALFLVAFLAVFGLFTIMEEVEYNKNGEDWCNEEYRAPLVSFEGVNYCLLRVGSEFIFIKIQEKENSWEIVVSEKTPTMEDIELKRGDFVW